MLAIGAQFVPNAFPCVYSVWLRQAHSTNPIIPMAHDFHNTIIDSCCRCVEHACGAHPQIHSAYMQPTRSGLFSDFIRYTHIWFVFFCFLYYKLNGGLVSGKCDLCIYTHMCVLCVVASCCFDCASGFFFVHFPILIGNFWISCALILHRLICVVCLVDRRIASNALFSGHFRVKQMVHSYLVNCQWCSRTEYEAVRYQCNCNKTIGPIVNRDPEIIWWWLNNPIEKIQ